MWYGTVSVEMILPSPPARAISFLLVRTTTLGQSVYPDIALHISNFYINNGYDMSNIQIPVDKPLYFDLSLLSLFR
jgi:hypothetical protein